MQVACKQMVIFLVHGTTTPTERVIAYGFFFAGFLDHWCFSVDFVLDMR